MMSSPIRQRPPARIPAVALCAATALAGCAVGPDFRPPASPVPADARSYTPTPVPAQTASAPVAGGAAQHYVDGAQLAAPWWTLFRSEPLDRLIRDAIRRSPSLGSTQAALRQAQENLNAQTGNLDAPSVTGSLGATRERSSTPPAGIYNLVNAGVNVSYTLDVFGANRRELEGLAALVDYQHYEVEGAYLTLVSNLVTTAIREASLRAQLQATREGLAAQQRQLALIEQQFDLGAVAKASVLTQRTAVAQTVASLPPLEKSLAQTRHQLAVYAGRLPSDTDLPEFTLDSLTLPEELPLTLPSSLARQRPDIRASEALLHQASAQVGVATANLYPQITLSGSFGQASSSFGKLFSGASTIWSFGGSLTQPLFNGGALRAQRRAAEAAYDQAAAQYQSTVLTAFQNVADSLRAIDSDAQTLQASADAESLARQSLDLSNQQYKLGAVSYITLLDAQRTWQQTRVSLVQAQAARYSDTAALLQSLGGGWWNRPGDLADPTALAPRAAASMNTN